MDLELADRINGTCDDRFSAVRDALAANLASGADVGASVACTIDGELVVDLWGGSAMYDDGERPWEADTIVNVWSTTKTMTAMCLLMLADRGQIDLDAPVADCWPEFSAHGKGAIATRHVLGHTSGLSGWDAALEPSDLADHDRLAALLADQAPWWEPGTASGYHAFTQGFLLGEIVRRVDGRTIGQYFAEEVASVVGADFHIGTPADVDHRVAHVIPPAGPLIPGQLPPLDSIVVRTLGNPLVPPAFSATHAWRRAEIPAAGGHGNARSVARCLAPLACGGTADGVTLLSPEGVERALVEQSTGQDFVLPTPVRFGTGYALPSPSRPFPSPRTCFWGGYGGSIAVADLDNRMSFAYVMNRMEGALVGDTRAAGLLLATYASLFTG